MKVTLILYPQIEGGYTIICPEIALTSQGETMEEAKQNIKELIDDYFENEKVADKDDYIVAYNNGNKIITEMEV